MVRESCRSSAPGSLMLMGEHAVLQGRAALVSAINKRLSVTLKPREDDKICIYSVLGEYRFSLKDLEKLGQAQEKLEQKQEKLKKNSPLIFKQHAPFHFITAVFLWGLPWLTQGFDCHVTSEFSDKIGFGSSSAVVVATLQSLTACLAVRENSLTSLSESDSLLFDAAKKVVLEVQGVGSGADVAASLLGGVVYYQYQAAERVTIMEKQAALLQLSALYSGYKTPTPEVIQKVEVLQRRNPVLYDQLYTAIHECSLQAKVALEKKDWVRLGQLMTQHQIYQHELGVSDSTLERLVQTLNNDPGIYGAKISGAGLGDCVIGLGVVQNQALSSSVIPLETDLQGARYE